MKLEERTSWRWLFLNRSRGRRLCAQVIKSSSNKFSPPFKLSELFELTYFPSRLRREREGRAPPSPPYDGVEPLFYQDEEEEFFQHGYPGHPNQPLQAAAQDQRQQDPAAYLPHQHQPLQAAAQAQRQQDPAYLPQRQPLEAAGQAQRR
ncbi:hypothetical protein A4X09_0g7130 [Tilletia walkeri]|uniref:Uncharacterized protein n=1 Tax=Tilletia walkeri TaxID=117179 RepID=A0A8X7T2E9_9BASI|nr:hypothetical protein A4X09_0g7130 [Tilletia walkeri]